MQFVFVPNAFADDYWDNVSYTSMPMFPPDGYVSMQNPPDFTWPYVGNVKMYRLQVLTDGGDSPPWASVVFYYDGTNNYYNHSAPMETGKTYYWRVRCDFINGTQSPWSKSKSFTIDPDAVEFIVPKIDTLMSKVKTTHPRVLTTDVNEFRKIKDTNETSKAVYDYYVDTARGYLTTYADGLPPEPTFDDATEWWDKELNTYRPDKYEEYVMGSRQYKWKSSAMLSIVQNSAYAYLLTGDDDIGKFAVGALVALAGWDIEGPTSYTFDSQRHREIVYQCSMAYDWLYNKMTETQRATVRNMIKNRIEKVYEVKAYVTDSSGNKIYDSSTGKYKTTVVSTSSMSTLLESLKRYPLDSMGWTAIGYIGIAAYALSGDFKAADSSLVTDPATDWLKTILPLYTAVMPPWSSQDGGWSQGTFYWRTATQTSKEFMDILALGDVINLYDKAYSQNEYLWALYAYPTGSYGSFGEGSNRTLPESEVFVRNAMSKNAYFTDNPIAAWISDSQGGPTKDNIYNYYSAQGMAEVKAPAEYPLSHVFNDVGLAVMTDSLTDTDRIQLSFKSSPYGTYNHSQQDQNAFIIQAYGENLAIKSGFYDYYNSPHSNNMERATYGRNTITVGYDGQTDKQLNAKGEITRFVNQYDFDSVTGSAHMAYSMLDRYDRSIIYVRPDVFIVIDDLKVSGSEAKPFEWWLNAENSISYTNTSALITKGNAALKADVHYPSTTAVYFDKFINPKDGTEYPPTGDYASMEPHKRVAFKTNPATETRMVVTMSVYKDGEEAKECISENKGSYLKLTYEDSNTVTLVNLGDVSTTVNAADEGITFTGAAVTYNDSSILLTNGTYLKKDSEEIISATNRLTAVIGLGQISLSSNLSFNATVDAFNDYIIVDNVSSCSRDSLIPFPVPQPVYWKEDRNKDSFHKSVDRS